MKHLQGNRVNLAFVSLVFTMSALMWAYCVWENRQRESGKRDYRAENLSKEDLDAGVLGFHHPEFRYSL